MAELTFRRLKSHSNATSSTSRKPLILPFRNPKDRSLLPVSVPERLLSELLARDLLHERQTVESLFQGKHFLGAKEEALDLPVFRSQHDHKRFMASRIMNDYIQKREKVLAHAVGSKTFRNHYDVGCNHTNFLGILKENGNALENGTARELNVVLRGDFQTAKANIGIPSGGSLSREELRLFVDEYEQQAADLDQRTIDERKQTLGKCGLMLWFDRDRPGYNMRYVFVDGMVRLTKSIGEHAATADELHESLKIFKSADFSTGLEMETEAATAGRAICTANGMLGQHRNDPHTDAMESASTADDMAHDNGAANQSADQLARSFGLEPKLFCPKIPATLNRKQDATKNIDTKSGEDMAASFALAAKMLDANSPAIPRRRIDWSTES